MTALESVESQSLIDLARQLVACPGFRWLPGMSTTYNCVVVATLEGVRRVDGDNIFGSRRCRTAALDELDLSDLPDLSDPATRGCVLQLVREAWGDEALHIMPCWRGDSDAPRSWSVWHGDQQVSEAPTEAEALVAALEAAPPRTAN